MRPDIIVFQAPPFNEHLSLFQGIEDLTVEPLIPQLAVETLNEAILPGASRLDIQGLNPDAAQPVSNRFGRKLRAVVRTDVLRNAMPDKKSCQTLQHIVSAEPTLHNNRQALPAVLVDHRQKPQRAPAMGTLCHKVIGPDVVPMGRSEPHTGSVVEPQAAPLGLLLRNLQPLLMPDPLHPLVIDPPALPL